MVKIHACGAVHWGGRCGAKVQTQVRGALAQAAQLLDLSFASGRREGFAPREVGALHVRMTRAYGAHRAYAQQQHEWFMHG